MRGDPVPRADHWQARYAVALARRAGRRDITATAVLGMSRRGASALIARYRAASPVSDDARPATAATPASPAS